MLDGPPIRAIDVAATRLAQRTSGTTADLALYALSQAANHSALWHGINAIDALTGDSARRRRALRRSVIVVVEQAFVNGPVKMVVGRDRPAARDDHPHALRVPRSSSFPSGHASAAACSATLLSRDLGLGPLWWSLAATVAWSRIHVGVHHGSDVAAGLALGRGLGLAAGRCWAPPGGSGAAAT